jgi:hypothetical protein
LWGCYAVGGSGKEGKKRGGDERGEWIKLDPTIDISGKQFLMEVHIVFLILSHGQTLDTCW